MKAGFAKEVWQWGAPNTVPLDLCSLGWQFVVTCEVGGSRTNALGQLCVPKAQVGEGCAIRKAFTQKVN